MISVWGVDHGGEISKMMPMKKLSIMRSNGYVGKIPHMSAKPIVTIKGVKQEGRYHVAALKEMDRRKGLKPYLTGSYKNEGSKYGRTSEYRPVLSRKRTYVAGTVGTAAAGSAGYGSYKSRKRQQ